MRAHFMGREQRAALTCHRSDGGHTRCGCWIWGFYSSVITGWRCNVRLSAAKLFSTPLKRGERSVQGLMLAAACFTGRKQ